MGQYKVHGLHRLNILLIDGADANNPINPFNLWTIKNKYS